MAAISRQTDRTVTSSRSAMVAVVIGRDATRSVWSMPNNGSARRMGQLERNHLAEPSRSSGTPGSPPAQFPPMRSARRSKPAAPGFGGRSAASRAPGEPIQSCWQRLSVMRCVRRNGVAGERDDAHSPLVAIHRGRRVLKNRNLADLRLEPDSQGVEKTKEPVRQSRVRKLWWSTRCRYGRIIAYASNQLRDASPLACAVRRRTLCPLGRLSCLNPTAKVRNASELSLDQSVQRKARSPSSVLVHAVAVMPQRMQPVRACRHRCKTEPLRRLKTEPLV